MTTRPVSQGCGYCIMPASYIAAQPLAIRLGFCRDAVRCGDFADLRAVVADMSRRLATERAESLRKQPAELRDCHWHRRRKWEYRWWLPLAARVPPGPCAYCGTPDARTVDHIVPPELGGDFWDLANLARACRRCNSQKGQRTPEQWQAWCLATGRPWPPAWEDQAA